MSTQLSKEEAFARLGAITREMHEALAVIGGSQLHDVVQEIPNARDRLAYVGKMTEDAANKVLTLVETAKPACDDLASRGVELGESLARLAAAPDMTVEKARGLMVVCGKFAQSTAQFADGQGAVLSDIMMSQDFQDLSGQVIQKVIDIITRTELQLVQLHPLSIMQLTRIHCSLQLLQSMRSFELIMIESVVSMLVQISLHLQNYMD